LPGGVEVVEVESFLGPLNSDNPARIALMKNVYDRMLSLAMTSEASKDFIMKLAGQTASHAERGIGI
jgi:hypothetical protein